MGGAWERLVRSVKTSLNAILKEKLVSDFQLITTLTEVEHLVNSHPLTPASDDINDLEPLTSNHFLLGRPNPNLPPVIVYQSRKRWCQVQHLVECFWKRWQREYLPKLTERGKWTKESSNMKVGDLVLTVDKNIPFDGGDKHEY